MRDETIRDSLRLAVSTPGGIELDQDILVVVNDQVLVGVGDNDGNGTLLLLGDGLRLDAGLNLAVQDLLDELANLLGINLLRLVVRVLGALDGVLNGECRELLGVQVQVVGVSTESLSIDGSDVDSAAVLLSDGLEVLSELLALLGGLSEDVGQRNASLISRSLLAKVNLTYCTPSNLVHTDMYPA